MLKELKFYIRLWFSLFWNSCQRSFEFRTNFFSQIFTESVWLFSQIVFVFALFNGHQLIGSWNQYELLFFFGGVTLLDAFWTLAIRDNMQEFQNLMRQGTFDFYLLRPTSVLFLTMARFQTPATLINVILSGGILIYAANHLPQTLVSTNMLLGGFYFILGIGLALALSITVISIGFWFVNTDSLMWLFFEFYRLGFRPDDFYFVWLRRILLSIFPAAFFVSIPVKIFLGKEISTWMLIGPWALLAICIFLVSIFWKRGIKHYEGALS